jgi:ABC-type branched-subunit amino acid transport system ATPase component
VGALIALPAIRLSGLFLALATLGFGVMVERLCYGLDFMFTSLAEGRTMPRPAFAAGDEAYYYLTLGFVIATAVLVVTIQRGRLGRILRGMAECPAAVTVSGLSTQVTKLIVFCLSAVLAAVSGILYGSSLQVASTTDVHYSSFSSVVLLASLACAPFVEPWYAVVMGMTVVIPAYLTGATTGYVMNVIFGAAAIQVAMTGGPPTLPTRWQQALDRVGGHRFAMRQPDLPDARRQPPMAVAPVAVAGADQDGLRVVDLEVRFGGVRAVKQFSLHAPMGQITGLIGPNGAGKTTTFNACTGLVRQSRGEIRLHGTDLSALGPAARARQGLGRTFQIMQLCESLTVVENVALGRECGMAGANVLAQLVSSPASTRTTARAAWTALEQCGIAHLADRQAHALSTGERRLVELARCLAGSFDVLLLDEPSSGLDRQETLAFGEVLQQVVRDRGVSILLVEHDMSLVMSICSYLYVVDFGVSLFHGAPDEVRASPVVRSAYLGSVDVDPRDDVSEAVS